jgi:hypothetical protein
MTNESLERVFSEESREKLLLAVAFPLAATASIREIAAEAGLAVSDAVRLMNEPAFIAQLRQVTFAQASMALHGSGIADLVKIATSGKDRERLTAWRVIAQITGDLKQKHQHDVRVTFEDLRKRESVGELGSLFDIRSNVIEGEIEE